MASTSTVYWTCQGWLRGGRTYTFYDPTGGVISGPEAVKLRQLIESHPNAVKRSAGQAFLRRGQVWIDRVPGKMGITKGRAGILMDIPPGANVVETLRNEWQAFDFAHRVGALRLAPQKTRELEQTLEFIGRSTSSRPGGIATAGIVAGAVIGFALLGRALMRHPARSANPLPCPWPQDPGAMLPGSSWGAPGLRGSWPPGDARTATWPPNGAPGIAPILPQAPLGEPGSVAAWPWSSNPTPGLAPVPPWQPGGQPGLAPASEPGGPEPPASRTLGLAVTPAGQSR